MIYKAEAQKNILKDKFKEFYDEFKLDKALSLIVTNVALLFEKYPSSTKRKEIVDALAYNREPFLKNIQTYPDFIQILCSICEKDKAFFQSNNLIDTNDFQNKKERKAFIKEYIFHVRAITLYHLRAISFQLQEKKKPLQEYGLMAKKTSSSNIEDELYDPEEEKENIDSSNNKMIPSI